MQVLEGAAVGLGRHRARVGREDEGEGARATDLQELARRTLCVLPQPALEGDVRVVGAAEHQMADALDGHEGVGHTERVEQPLGLDADRVVPEIEAANELEEAPITGDEHRAGQTHQAARIPHQRRRADDATGGGGRWAHHSRRSRGRRRRGVAARKADIPCVEVVGDDVIGGRVVVKVAVVV